MSLQVWLPLIKDISNQGLSGISVTNNGATYNSEGKLGGCYYFNGSSHIRISMPTIMTSIKNSSVCAWVKSTGSVVALGGISNDGNYTNAQMTLYTSGWQFGGTTTYKYVGGGSIANSGVWHHVVCTLDDTTIRTYLDGTLVNAKSLTDLGTIVTGITSANFIEIGCDHPGGDEYLTGYVNDFRIYNHALSAKEVKELSKGLVAHYTLNDAYIENTTNLINLQCIGNATTGWGGNTAVVTTVKNDNAPIPCGKCNKVDVTYSGSGSGGFGLYVQNISCSASSTYTYSCYIKTPDILAPLNANVLYRYEYNGSTQVKEAGCWTSAQTESLGDNWYRVYGTFTVTENTTNFTLYSFMYPNKTCVYYIGCWQLELKDHKTPYVFGSRNENIVYDSSGYNYHGITVGALVIGNDAPRYSISTSFNTNSDSVTLSPCFSVGQTMSEFSCSCWCKTNTLNSTAPNLWSLGENSFVRIRYAHSNGIWYYVRIGSTQCSSTYSVSTNLIDNKWHHTVFVFKSGIVKVYLDGVQIGTTDHSAVATYMNCNNAGNTWHLAGYTATSEKMIGSLSDFKIYTTAISDDDIKELYQTGASIDNRGNMYAYELREV